MLYGKDGVITLISSMIKNKRLSHSFILLGERGVGKKTLAEYLAKMILCQSGNSPCGICKSCLMCENGAHPDLIRLSASGRQENFRADDLRFLISDASVSANEGGHKVYILPEIDKALPAAQNVLLKIIEEPPANVVFIMTATSKEKILSTVLSRSVSLAVPQASEDDCIKALEENGISRSDAERAVKYFGGNIGACLEYLEGSSDDHPFEAVQNIVSALTSGDEYVLARELNSLERDRAFAVKAIGVLQSVIRDALTAKFGNISPISPMREEAVGMSKIIRTGGLEKMYSACSECISKISGNASMTLALADLACKLKTYSLK